MEFYYGDSIPRTETATNNGKKRTAAESARSVDRVIEIGDGKEYIHIYTTTTHDSTASISGHNFAQAIEYMADEYDKGNVRPGEYQNVQTIQKIGETTYVVAGYDVTRRVYIVTYVDSSDCVMAVDVCDGISHGAIPKTFYDVVVRDLNIFADVCSE